MTIISISGATSRAGKTSLAVTLARSLTTSRFKAIKFTTAEDDQVGCARGSPCTVCDIDVDFRIITDQETLEQAGTDTARLTATGAERVLWCITRRSALERAWKTVQTYLEPEDILILEGSTVLKVMRPDISFFVVNPTTPSKRWKESSSRLIPAADFVCINIPSRKRSIRLIDKSFEAVRKIRGRDDILRVDVQKDLRLWPNLGPLTRIRRIQSTFRKIHTATSNSPRATPEP